MRRTDELPKEERRVYQIGLSSRDRVSRALLSLSFSPPSFPHCRLKKESRRVNIKEHTPTDRHTHTQLYVSVSVCVNDVHVKHHGLGVLFHSLQIKGIKVLFGSF